MRIVRVLAALAPAFVGVLAGAGASGAQAATVSIACSALGTELRLCREGAEAWARHTGHDVAIVSTPNSATERLALYQQILSASGSDIDIYQIDVIWTGLLGQHFIDLRQALGTEAAAHLEAVVASATVEGELKAMPWFADAGILYYRADLLERYALAPPATWQELAAAARVVMEGERAVGREGLWGFVFQGRAYEGLTANALEWIDSFGGGTIVADDGTVTVANRAAAEALSTVAGFVGTITPRGVLNYAEEEARGVFQSGRAVFMRNWPYAYALAQSDESPVRGRVGVVALPAGTARGHPSATLGGQLLAVSRHSAHPQLAVDLVRHLTSRPEQRRRALEGAFNPTIADLYQDEALLEALPFLRLLAPTVRQAVARPSAVTGQSYNRVSSAVFNAVHRILSGRAEADEELAALERALAR